MEFRKATRKEARLRLALAGPAGSGKTYTALLIARGLVGAQGRIAVIDTERGSASLYADDPKIAGQFDVFEPDDFSPRTYIDAIHSAEEQKFDLLIIDGLSHAWAGKDGVLEMVDRETARSRSSNSWAAWRTVTPIHNQMLDAILQAKMHVIVTMRTKTEWIVEKDERTNKSAPRKIGMQPVQRDGMEYEFTVVGDMDASNTLVVTKTRCPALAGGVFEKPNGELSRILREWLDSAAAEEIAVETEEHVVEPESEIKKNAPAQHSNAATAIITSYRETIAKAVSEMRLPMTDVTDLLKTQHNVERLEQLSHDAAMKVMQTIQRQKALFVQFVTAVKALQPHFNDEEIAEEVYRILCMKAEAYAGMPLRGSIEDWGQWLDELRTGKETQEMLV